MRQKKKIIHIHATCLNLGDEAIVDSIYNLFPDGEYVFFDVTSYTLKNKRIYGYCNDFNLAVISSEISRADAVLIGGGDLITAWEFTYIVIILAYIYNIPVICLGIGVDIQKIARSTAILARIALKVPEYFIVRDLVSYNILKDISRKNVIKTSDVVYSYANSLNGYENSFKIPFDNFIAVSLRVPEYTSLIWGESQYREIAASLDHIIEKYDIDVVFIPMLSSKKNVQRSSKINEDEIAFDIVRKNMRSPMNRSVILDDIENYKQALFVISKAQLLLGARLHSIIFASLVGVPFIALSYGVKTDSFLDEIKMSDFKIAIDSISHKELIIKVDYIFDRYSEVIYSLEESKNNLVNQTSVYREMLEKITFTNNKYQQYGRLKKIFSSLFIKLVSNYFHC